MDSSVTATRYARLEALTDAAPETEFKTQRPFAVFNGIPGRFLRVALGTSRDALRLIAAAHFRSGRATRSSR